MMYPPNRITPGRKTTSKSTYDKNGNLIGTEEIEEVYTPQPPQVPLRVILLLLGLFILGPVIPIIFVMGLMSFALVVSFLQQNPIVFLLVVGLVVLLLKRRRRKAPPQPKP